MGPTSVSSSNKQLSSYYESLRSNVMSILGQVKVPTTHVGTNMGDLQDPHGSFNASKENFDSYLTKLQNICTENMNSEEVKPIHNNQVHMSNHMNNHTAAGVISAIGNVANNSTLPTSI